MRICVVGLGRMGRGMAINLANKGHEVYGYDVDQRAIEAARSTGKINVANDVKSCASNSDYVIFALPTGRESLEVLNNIGGFRGIIMDTTTMGMGEVREVLKVVESRGLRYLSIRVERGPRDAEQGNLILYVGGDEGLYKESLGILNQLGTPIYVGSHEQVTALKLISNTILTANTIILAEVSAVIRRMGIDPDLVVKALSMGGADSAQLRTRLPWMLKGNYPESFSIRLARDVIDKALEYAQSMGIQLPITTLIDELLRIAEAAGYGSRDFSEIAEMLKVNERK